MKLAGNKHLLLPAVSLGLPCRPHRRTWSALLAPAKWLAPNLGPTNRLRLRNHQNIPKLCELHIHRCATLSKETHCFVWSPQWQKHSGQNPAAPVSWHVWCVICAKQYVFFEFTDRYTYICSLVSDRYSDRSSDRYEVYTSDIHPDKYADKYSGINPDIHSDRYHGIHSEIYHGKHSDVYHDIPSDINSDMYPNTHCDMGSGYIKVMICIYMYYRRKFRSQTSDNMDRWKAEQGRGREKRKIRREKSSREGVRRKKMQMREKVGKSRNTVFFQWFVAPEGRKVGSLKRRVRSQLARWEMKNCTPLWREAHFEVKMYKTLGVRTTFGSWDVEKVHAVVARSTFRSENVQNTTCSRHFWRFRSRKSARRCGAKHISKSKCTKH